MKKIVILSAGLALAIGAMAADKVDQPKALKLTDAQLATRAAGTPSGLNSQTSNPGKYVDQTAQSSYSSNSRAYVCVSSQRTQTSINYACGL